MCGACAVVSSAADAAARAQERLRSRSHVAVGAVPHLTQTQNKASHHSFHHLSSIFFIPPLLSHGALHVARLARTAVSSCVLCETGRREKPRRGCTDRPEPAARADRAAGDQQTDRQECGTRGRTGQARRKESGSKHLSQPPVHSPTGSGRLFRPRRVSVPLDASRSGPGPLSSGHPRSSLRTRAR